MRSRATFATVLTLLTAAVCLADGPTVHGDAASASPAPNQSVSIETAGDGPSDGPVNVAERSIGSSRLVRRKPTVGDLADTDRSTPWYRTGLGALAIVLALVGAAFWLVRRWMPSARTVDASVMKIVGRTGLTPKHSLALVRVGRRYVMVGGSADRLDSLCEISDPEEVAELSARVGIDRSLAAEPFDTLLAGEASDYQDSEPSPSDTTTTKRSRLAGPSGSLTGLLGRLRALQG